MPSPNGSPPQERGLLLPQLPVRSLLSSYGSYWALFLGMKARLETNKIQLASFPPFFKYFVILGIMAVTILIMDILLKIIKQCDNVKIVLQI